jgi:hypothetical protein
MGKNWREDGKTVEGNGGSRELYAGSRSSGKLSIFQGGKEFELMSLGIAEHHK